MAEGFIPADQVVSTWGEAFKDVAGHSRVMFTESSIHVVLRTPVHGAGANGEDLEEIVLQELTTAQMKMTDEAKGDVGKTAVLIQQSSGLPANIVNKIKSRDFMLLSKVAACFLADGQ